MKLRIGFLLGLGVLLAACGDDSTSPDGDQLTRAEAVVIAGQATASLESAASQSMNANSTSGADFNSAPPITIRRTLEATVPCASAGRIALTADVRVVYDGDAKTLVVDLDGSQRHQGCSFLHEGITFTLDGDPDISFEGHAAARDNQPDGPFTGNLEGGFDWTASDGRRGNCSIDLASTTDFAAKKRTIQGSVCGHTITDTLTWS